MKSAKIKFLFFSALALVGFSTSVHRVYAGTRISIGVTETMETFNPYADSVSLMYSVWCQVLGCLGTYDFDKGQHVGLLVERWEVRDPKNWIFYLRKNNRFHDGSPVTADDVVHSIWRTRNDPLSKQRQNISAIASEAALDKYTVRITTKEPTAPLLDYLFDRVIVTSKAIYDKYGPDVADRQHPVGAGPYKFRELIPGQRLVIGKDPSHPMIQQYPLAPDEIVFRIMREPEQRVTALLNNEIQIAQFVPQFHNGTMHVRLYRADIQIEKRPDLFQAQIVVVPQREGGPLARRQPVERCFQTPVNLPRKIAVLGFGPGG